MGGLGFLGIRYPADYGGSEMDTLATVVLAEELGRSTFAGVAITVLVHTDMASVHLFNAGSEALKARWMPEVVAGEAIVAVGVTEPGPGPT
jgi:acyl-CoA dehydrogenase